MRCAWLLAASLFGCAGNDLAQQVRTIKDKAQAARDAGAYVCAPRDLAIADTNVEFAEVDLREGDYFRAKEHAHVAAEHARLAYEGSPREKCTGVPVPRPHDADGDGIVDELDKCPNEPEDKDGFQDEDGCPDPDNDGDGLLDKVDRCPDEPEDKDGYQDEDGCPDPDNDNDGVLDGTDKCPNEPGPKENDGCPDKDTDGDGIVDRLDRCPKDPGPPGSDGCPQKFKNIVVTEEKIELRQKIFFATNMSNILPRSFAMMNEVAVALGQRPSMRVRIEGHTDSRGSRAHNLVLSQGRADSVRLYLASHGVDPGRLEAVGYGPDRPLATNKTSAGREQNRRVEFIITQP